MLPKSASFTIRELLSREKERQQGTHVSSTPPLSLEQVICLPDFMSELSKANDGLLELMSRNLKFLFLKAVETSSWSQKSTHVNELASIYSLPFIGPAEKLRFNYICMDAICSQVQFAAPEDSMPEIGKSLLT